MKEINESFGAGEIAWSDEELEAAVVAYLEMLEAERFGTDYSKAGYNRVLREGPLARRSKGSVEYRMANISEVLRQLGVQWLRGYTPAPNVGTNVHARIEALLHKHGVR